MMNRRISVIASIVVLLVAVIAPSYAWKFVSIADSRGSGSAVNGSILSQIISHINSESPDLVVFEGDAIDTPSSDSVCSSWMDTWVSYMNKLTCPWYYTPGNHEVNTSTVQENVLRAKVVQPTNGPSGDLEMVYSFDHQNAHFAFLNSNHNGQAHHVQRSWLASDLAKTTQPHIFVMVHEPAYPMGAHIGSSLDVYPSERDDLWNIMTNGHVSMLLCGHEHFYGRSKHGSIYQVINGTCGAPLYTGYSGTNATYNYLVVDINGYNVACTAKDYNGKVIDSWTYSVTLPTSTSPNIELSLAADKTSARPADIIKYTITYKNTSSATAQNIHVKMAVPTNTTYVTASAGASGIYDSASNSVTWTIPSLAASASGTCTMQVKVK